MTQPREILLFEDFIPEHSGGDVVLRFAVGPGGRIARLTTTRRQPYRARPD